MVGIMEVDVPCRNQNLARMQMGGVEVCFQLVRLRQ